MYKYVAVHTISPYNYSDPSIELTLQSRLVSVEGLAVLICTISGVSEVHNFSWYHNGELRLEAGIDISIEHLGTVGKLSIHDIAIEEAGNYTCIAHTSNTTTPLQKSIILRLQVPPRVMAEPHQFVLWGNNATLRCNITGDPEPVVLWIRNGQRINPDENTRYSEPQLGLLKFTNATTDDAGVYECRASNAKGNDMTNITLIVLTIPIIQSHPSILTEAGLQTILHCDATGIDTPTISWRSGGIDVGTSNDSRLISYSNGSLVITNTKVLDTGNYSCIAKNEAGSTSFTTTLNVTGHPVLLVPPENTKVNIGNTARLFCLFLANPNDGAIHWQWKGGNLPSSSDKYNIIADGTLIIREITDNDSGEYQCTATNSKGNITAKVNLIVINQPFTPDNLQQAGSAGAQMFTVSWNAPGQSDTTRPVNNYLIILRLAWQQADSTIQVPHNQTQYTFTNLLPGNQYEVLIAAYNQVGTSSYTDPLAINTIPTVPALEYFIANKSETDEVQLNFMWEIKYNGGYTINNLAIQYQDVQNVLEDSWTDLFTRGLDEHMEMYKPESLPPPGTYVFRAVIGNILGNNFYKHFTEINISEAIPGQPSKPEASEITSDLVVLNFDIVFMGTGAVKQFVLSVTGHSEETQIFLADDKINLSSDVKVTFDGLEADSTYRFQVAAMNDIGIGPFSEMSDEVTTAQKDETFAYIIIGTGSGFTIIVVIWLIILFLCYMCNRKMKAHS